MIHPSIHSESLSRILAKLSYSNDCDRDLQAKLDFYASDSVDTAGLIKTTEVGSLNLLVNSSQTFLNELRECLPTKRVGYYELMSLTFGIPVQVIKDILEPNFSSHRKKLNDQVVKAFDNNNILDAVLKVGSDFHHQTREIEKTFDPHLSRVFGPEDHADEVAVKVLFKMGRATNGLNSFLLNSLSEWERSCQRYPYKRFDEPSSHPHSCWRIKRNQALWQSLGN